MKPVHNFNAGPAALPHEVLQKAQQELLDFAGTGMSVMELSHRSRDYGAVHQAAKSLLRELMDIPETHEVLFIQGGANLQFSMVPLNLLGGDAPANYLLTGVWSEKALQEAAKVGPTRVGASTRDTGYRSVPSLHSIDADASDAYLHITTNNTIYGTQWHELPEHNCLVADMSSDILSRPVDVSRFGLIYAGAQKNLGPAGVTVVIIRRSLLEREAADLPTMLQYTVYGANDSLYNTPPTFAIYLMGLVLRWVSEQGGAASMAEQNQAKAARLYQVIDDSGGFYQGHAQKGSRSFMNVTFNLGDAALESRFLQAAAEAGFVGLKGHRSIGGCRASLYNAVPEKSVEALCEFMQEFQRVNIQ